MIRKIASSITGSEMELVQNGLIWTKENLRMEESENKNQLFRQRTAEEIIKSKFITGCTDAALAFISLMRARKIPAVFVETIDKKWLESKNEVPIYGHVYVEVFLDSKWYLTNPMYGKTEKTNKPRERVIFAKGLDSCDIGITNFSDLKQKFLVFRNKWRQKNLSNGG
ncbi:hypothetical protein A2Z23_00905 [Candidatus Curtissbacteria bacterium RBG_16_39_7]|uniref:Transglutaminase-like domain-containing protein n=1 Tax=Candidatus Curtissbacteria bacterium RBG_16_39_7 TaxID=1797707 RepID=A0A1F5G1W9_9BACT|nr:MAG: hypothetical protein A2Z23_00905 [Candidatus Curtissbacteria bacterium RBG_16_39_7]